MTLRLESLQSNKGARRRKLRKGRGIAAGQGASCGFGMRGQKSRSGRPTRPGFEGGQMPLYRRVPKLKHFTLVNPKSFTVLNVSALNEIKAGSTVNLDSLVKDGIVTSPKSPLKILGNGELKAKLTVQAAAFTASARAKIEAAGGTCEVLDWSHQYDLFRADLRSKPSHWIPVRGRLCCISPILFFLLHACQSGT